MSRTEEDESYWQQKVAHTLRLEDLGTTKDVDHCRSLLGLLHSRNSRALTARHLRQAGKLKQRYDYDSTSNFEVYSLLGIAVGRTRAPIRRAEH